jgi:assimilatory nitrate reductase catalytic subunit
MRGRIVCTCLDVSESEITTAFAQGADLAGLQARLKCGTECGTCVPELKRLCVQLTSENLKRT